jgi:hypothetical protein
MLIKMKLFLLVNYRGKGTCSVLYILELRLLQYLRVYICHDDKNVFDTTGVFSRKHKTNNKDVTELSD